MSVPSEPCYVEGELKFCAIFMSYRKTALVVLEICFKNVYLYGKTSGLAEVLC